MNISLAYEPKSLALLTIEVMPAEYAPFLPKGAKKIALEAKLPGFRPGNAPYEVIKQKFGEAEILKESLPAIITETFVRALKEKNLDTLGEPEINILKLAPDNDLVYTAKVPYLASFDLPDISQIKITKKEIKISEKDIDKTLSTLIKSRATEKIVAREARDKDLVKLDYDISLDGVPQENGQAKNIEIYLGEHHMLPGFEAQLIGLKTGEIKKFHLTFPTDYFQKNFAGKTCDFHVKINGVYELFYPELNDDFAKNLGKFSSLAELKEQLKNNLQLDKEYQANIKLENELLEKIIKATAFPELPDQLMEHEIDNTLHEFEHDLISRGLQLAIWLQNLNKTMEQFRLDLRPEAQKRAQASLLVRAFAQKNNITISDEETNKELDQALKNYKDDAAALNQIKTPAYRVYLHQALLNQKTIAWLKEKIII